MRNISSAFRRALYDGNRNYQCTAYITLVDDTELEITNARIAQGGVSLDDNVSDTSSFTALGSAIINALTLQINNIYEEYSGYDFTGASVILYISLTGVQDSPIKICTMTVEKASYNGMIITLECLDNMVNFDKPYTSSLTYPATLQNIVSNACTDCGVILGTTTFPNYTLEISERPNDEALTYREVISYVATLAGCFARCNSSGLLELKWFDKNALIAIEDTINGGIFDEDSPYSTGDTVNGGIFNLWNTGDEVDGGEFTDSINAHYITALSSQDLGIDDVVITGIQITIQNDDADDEEEPTTDIITRTYGTSDYVLKIENNPFITIDNIDTIGTFLQTNIVGLTFRYGTISHLNDPSIEAGDVAMVWDRKGNAYPLLITNTQFSVGSYQNTTCSADTPAKNSATRFSALTKSFVENKEIVRKESNALETRLNQAIDAKAGMYETRVQEAGGGYTYYMHDKPNLSNSSAVIKITNEAVGVTPDYQASPVQWYGLTVDGNFIANIMSVIGINFDWGTGGTLTLGGQNNQNGVLTVLDASGNTIGTWNKDGFVAKSGSTNASFAVDDSSIRLVDREGTEFFRIADLRNENGYARLTYRLEIDSEMGLEPHQDLLTPSTAMKDVISVYYNNTLWVEGTDYEVNYNYNSIVNLYALHLYPNDVFEVTYLADDVRLKAYTLGTRAKYTDSGYYSVSMGVGNTIDGEYSTAIGKNNTIGNANDSFVAGLENVANGTSWMLGWGLKSGTDYQTIVGLWNKPLDDTLKYALIVGGGLGDDNRFNAMTVDRDGILKTGSLITNIASKSTYNDGVAGTYIGADGTIHLTRSATSGGYIGFHYGLGATTTSYIDEPASGVLRISGKLRINGHSTHIGYMPTQATGNISLTASTFGTVASVALSAGVWVLTGTLSFSSISTNTFVTGLIRDSSESDNSMILAHQYAISGYTCVFTISRIIKLDETKTVYLRARAGVARTCTGWLDAVRIQ